jgi:hypothetical protein
MSVLGKVTDEYFGKIVREEELMRPPKMDSKHPPKRYLTTDEMEFLSALAKYTMFFDRSLFFQIEDLWRHTELVLSGARNIRSEFSNPDELKREIEELKKLIEELRQEDWELRRLLEGQLGKLKEALTLEEYGTYTTMLLGEYKHNNGYDSEVILYVNNIETLARKDPAKTMYLMGKVLLHEYFHSFYYHVGIATRDRIRCVEEPLAEYGSLVALYNVAKSGSPFATEADKALTYTYSIVKSKQKSMGHTAAYGFGAYLYDNHKDDYHELIANYANVSRLLDEHGAKALEYKYMVYPKYPVSFEAIAYKKLRELLASVTKVIGRSTGKLPKISPTPTFTSIQIANSIKAYLFDGMSFRSIEQMCLGMPRRANGGGFVAKKLLNGKGITSSDKRHFYGKTIAQAIAMAPESLKTTLIWMDTHLRP